MGKKMLVVVDYQKDFVDGALGFEGAEKLDTGIHDKIREYMDRGDYIVYTKDTHYKNYLDTREGKELPVEHCIEKTEGHNLYGKVASINEEEYGNKFNINKETFGACIEGKRLKSAILESMEIELVGVVTNMCVISNAIVFQSHNVEAQIVVDASLCGSFNRELHEKALDVMEGLQIKVINR